MSDINDILILTGARISAESGFNTFRASDGLCKNHRVVSEHLDWKQRRLYV